MTDQWEAVLANATVGNNFQMSSSYPMTHSSYVYEALQL